LRVLVEGDLTGEGSIEAAQRLVAQCKTSRVEINTGDTGKIVRIVTESAVRCYVYRARDEKPNAPEIFNGEIVDCRQGVPVAKKSTKTGSHEGLSLAVRIAMLIKDSSGFLFFPGEEGTLAGLFTILAFLVREHREKGSSLGLRVALVGWGPNTLINLASLYFQPTDMSARWVKEFGLGETYEALCWLARESGRRDGAGIGTTSCFGR